MVFLCQKQARFQGRSYITFLLYQDYKDRLYLQRPRLIWDGILKGEFNDGIVRHPIDAKAWDEKYPPFALDLRNARLGIASDGFNPYGSLLNEYSTGQQCLYLITSLLGWAWKNTIISSLYLFLAQGHQEMRLMCTFNL